VVRDANLVTWYEYFDAKSQRFYYYQPTDKTTRWDIEFSRSVSNRVPANIIDLNGVRAVLREPLTKKKSNPISELLRGRPQPSTKNTTGNASTSAFMNPFRHAPSVAFASAQDMLPTDFEALARQDAASELSDPAGRLRLVHLWSPLDHLEGIGFARKSFPMLIRPTNLLILRFVDEVQDLEIRMPEVCAKFPEGDCSRSTLKAKYRSLGHILAATRAALEATLLADEPQSVGNEGIDGIQSDIASEHMKSVCAVSVSGDASDATDAAACAALQSIAKPPPSSASPKPNTSASTTSHKPSSIFEAVADGSIWNLLGDVWLVSNHTYLIHFLSSTY
jgi:hypothetical protein